MRAHGSLRNRVPLAPGRKRRAATPEEPGLGELTNDTFRTKLPGAPERGKTTVLAIAVDTLRVDATNPS
jgi:hypothetical protein